MISPHRTHECAGCLRLDGDELNDDCWLCQSDDDLRASYPASDDHLRLASSSEAPEARA